MIYAIDRFFSRMPVRQLLLLCLLQVVFLGIVDWATGYELAFAVFYLVPVSIAAWYSGRGTTYGIALLATGMWLGAEYTTDLTYTAQWILYWNSAVRLTFFVVVAFLIRQLRSHMEAQQRLARTDELTGLLNRAGFMELAEVLDNTAARYDLSLVIGFIDLDGFKQVNDTLGHSQGDEVLKAIGAMLRQATRESDVIARIGGDEFAVLLPNTSLDGAHAYFSKLHRQLLEGIRRHGNHEIGVSIGAAVFEKGPPPLREALILADALMYRAKKSANTSVVVETPHEIAEKSGIAQRGESMSGDGSMSIQTEGTQAANMRPELMESAKGHYLAVFTSNKASPKWQAWFAMSAEERAAKDKMGLAALAQWNEDHAADIVYIGGPLGPTKRTSEDGVTDIVNELTVFVVVRAPSHRAAAELFKDHPHFTIFPCDSVDVMPLLG